MYEHLATASDLPFYDILAPQKIPFSKFLMASLHVICGLGPSSQLKILATPMVTVTMTYNKKQVSTTQEKICVTLLQ